VLSDEELRADLISEAREHVLDFDWLDVAGQTAAIYEALLGQRTAPERSGGREAAGAEMADPAS
jgi:glycogen(starch) synthase